MDGDGDWFLGGDDDNSNTINNVVDEPSSGDAPAEAAPAAAKYRPIVPAGPPVPNPYAHCVSKHLINCTSTTNLVVCMRFFYILTQLRVPTVNRRFEHWARSKRLQYNYNEEYAKLYYDDCIDYMDKRLKGVNRDLPRPQEWPERVLRLYARDGERLSASDWKYWWTDANHKKPLPDVFHAVHSKESILRQYKSVLC